MASLLLFSVFLVWSVIKFQPLFNSEIWTVYLAMGLLFASSFGLTISLIRQTAETVERLHEEVRSSKTGS